LYTEKQSFVIIMITKDCFLDSSAGGSWNLPNYPIPIPVISAFLPAIICLRISPFVQFFIGCSISKSLTVSYLNELHKLIVK
jgi:hypothetical protein